MKCTIPAQSLGTYTITTPVRFGNLLTPSEMNEVEGRTEKPLITLYSDRIRIAYDRSDFVIEIPITRHESGVLE